MSLTELSGVMTPSCANTFSIIVGIIATIKANARIDEGIIIELGLNSYLYLFNILYNNWKNNIYNIYTAKVHCDYYR